MHTQTWSQHRREQRDMKIRKFAGSLGATCRYLVIFGLTLSIASLIFIDVMRQPLIS